MKKKEIHKYLPERVRELHRNYKLLLRHFEPEAVHNFRVGYKKMRACFRLFNTGLNKDDQLKTGKKLDNFYHLAGNLRNLQLHHSRIGNLAKDLLVSTPVQYLALIENETGKNIKELEALSATVTAGYFADMERQAANETYNEDATEGFINHNRMRLLQLIFLPDYKDENLHSIRKLLKDFFYNKPFLIMSRQTILPPPFSGFETLEQFTEKLGNFNDLCIALELLNADAIALVENEGEKNVLLFMQKQLVWSKQIAVAELKALFTSVKADLKKSASNELAEVGMQ